MPGLVGETAETFKIGEVSGDKAYGSQDKFDVVEKHGGRFYPMFKDNATGGIGGSFESVRPTPPLAPVAGRRRAPPRGRGDTRRGAHGVDVGGKREWR